jgi:predicted RNase H-like nuclease
MPWTVVGVDCAIEEKRIGLAYGIVDDEGVLELKRATLGTAGESAAATVASWIAGASQFVVALDAPLGWPSRLAASLSQHRAGEPMLEEAERLFRRDTDHFVRRELGKLPAAVGADRIARTARAALELLSQIRAASRQALALAWVPGRDSGVIEVYPAATLLSRGIGPGGYKVDTAAGRKARAAILERLQVELQTAIERSLLLEDDDLLDAVVCAVAAADFARGRALPPEDAEVAEREGWIWFRGLGQTTLF